MNDSESFKVPPHSIEAEQSVLGGLMLDNQAWIQIADKLSEEDFYRSDHRLIFSSIKALAEDNHPCDVITLGEWLDARGKLDEAGSLAYLGMLAKNTPSAANIVAYANIVRERSVLRQLVRVGTDIAGSAFNPQGRGVKELLDEAEKNVFAIAEQGARQGGFKPIKNLLAMAVDKIDMLYRQDEAITGISTGFKDFDEQTSGLQPSDLIIVAGRPSMGKCCAAETQVLLSDGRLAAIAELFLAGAGEVMTYAEERGFYPASPESFVHDGRKPVFRLHTEEGRYVDVTASHPFLTPQGWKPLGELQAGERIAMPARLPVFGKQQLSAEHLSLLAKLCKKPNLRNAEDLALLAQQGIVAADTEIAQLWADLEAWGWDCSPLCQRGLPSIVLQLTQPCLAEFLRHLLGSARIDDKRLRYVHASETLCRQVQHLLLRFGIRARLWRNQAPLWEVQIYSSQARRQFVESIGGVDEQISQQWRRFSLTDEQFLAWETITLIEELGTLPVYDLCVAETHNFVANDLCLHNTSYAMNVAEHVAIYEGLPVAVFSMEMPGDQLAMRLIASLGRIDQHKVRTGKLGDDDWPKLSKAISELAEAPMFIDDSPALSPTELRARCRRLAREYGGQLGLVVVDYLQLMQVPGYGDNRALEVSEISRSLKALAKEMQVPVIALSQLNRGLEQRPNKRPVMSDLRESGCLSGDTLIPCARTGETIALRDWLGRDAPQVLAMQADQQIRSSAVSHAFCTGVKPVFSLQTEAGQHIKATANHRFYRRDGWQRLDALQPGDELAMHAAGATQAHWQRIQQIQPAGEEAVYDLTVPGPHNFVANDFVVHNSIEQDADLIIFIYRDEVYNQESEDKGTAEIIVAKQRNGPIGTTRLSFLGQFTRFENFSGHDFYHDDLA